MTKEATTVWHSLNALLPTVGKVQDGSPHLVLGLGLLTVSQI